MKKLIIAVIMIATLNLSAFADTITIKDKEVQYEPSKTGITYTKYDDKSNVFIINKSILLDNAEKLKQIEPLTKYQEVFLENIKTKPDTFYFFGLNSKLLERNNPDSIQSFEFNEEPTYFEVEENTINESLDFKTKDEIIDFITNHILENSIMDSSLLTSKYGNKATTTAFNINNATIHLANLGDLIDKSKLPEAKFYSTFEDLQNDTINGNILKFDYAYSSIDIVNQVLKFMLIDGQNIYQYRLSGFNENKEFYITNTIFHINLYENLYAFIDCS